jgi:PAS domain S-box-containing protein
MPPESPSGPAHDSLSEGLFHVQHHALLRAILDNISEGVSIMDASGQFVYTSPFAQRVYDSPDNSSPPSEWASRHGLFRPDGQTPFPVDDLPIWKALKGQEARNVDMFVRNANAPEGMHIRLHCVPVRDGQGRILGAMALTQDVDKLLKSETEKRQTEQRFRLLVETAQEGIWTLDDAWRTTYVNRHMTRMLGYSGEEMLGLHLFTFLDEEGRKALSQRLDWKSAPSQAEARDLQLVRKDGTSIWASLSTTPIFDEEGNYTGALAMVTDITQRRRAEEQVRQLNAELEQRIADRTAQLEYSNRELEAFAYSVAHDLRAPLRSIASFSDALREDCASQLDAVGQDYLRRIVGGAKRMADLIDGILALSRVNSTELVAVECDLSDMAWAVIAQLRELQPERKVRVIIQEGLRAQGDPKLLRSLLENLLGNAWKFTRERPEAEIELSATRNGRGLATYVVRDNGAGFDMAFKDKLFGVFQRLHAQNEFEGNGVGLATVQRIVRRHGGRIWGEGQPGHGARFFFTLSEFPLPPRTTAGITGKQTP